MSWVYEDVHPDFKRYGQIGHINEGWIRSHNRGLTPEEIEANAAKLRAITSAAKNTNQAERLDVAHI